MDEIVHKIYSSLNEDDLFIIVSDHGMANEGGHGGSSRMETLTPLVMISNSKFSDDKKLDDFELIYNQLDCHICLVLRLRLALNI